MQAGNHQVTKLLADAGAGSPAAAEQLLPLVYDELRALASSFFRQHSGNVTLQPTALVHEAYVRLVQPGEDSDSQNLWNSRAHFFAVAAKAMRQILSNHARDRRAAKRGGGWRRVTLSHAFTPATEPDIDLIAIDEVLGRLTELDARQSSIVELRFFCDMTVPDIARVLEISVSTVEREWRMARAWIASQLAGAEA